MQIKPFLSLKMGKVSPSDHNKNRHLAAGFIIIMGDGAVVFSAMEQIRSFSSDCNAHPFVS